MESRLIIGLHLFSFWLIARIATAVVSMRGWQPGYRHIPLNLCNSQASSSFSVQPALFIHSHVSDAWLRRKSLSMVNLGTGTKPVSVKISQNGKEEELLLTLDNVSL